MYRDSGIHVYRDTISEIARTTNWSERCCGQVGIRTCYLQNSSVKFCNCGCRTIVIDEQTSIVLLPDRSEILL
jgi:hypothetical protein